MFLLKSTAMEFAESEPEPPRVAAKARTPAEVYLATKMSDWVGATLSAPAVVGKEPWVEPVT